MNVEEKFSFLVRTLMRTTIKTIAAGIVFTASATLLLATTLPESYPLNEAEPTKAAFDPNLAQWLDEHVDQVSPLELPPPKFAQLLKGQDATTKLYLVLARANHDGDTAQANVAAQGVGKLLASDVEAERQEFLSHPMMPSALFELITTKAQSPDLDPLRAKASEALSQYGGQSCAAKRLVYAEITKENLASDNEAALKDLLARVDQFHSAMFRKNALKKFVSALPENKQEEIADDVYTIASAYPSVVNSTPWLHSLKEEKDRSNPKLVMQIRFDEVKKLAHQRQCAKAKQNLIDALKPVKAEKVTKKGAPGGQDSGQDPVLDAAVTTGKAVDACYRRRDAGQRREFWNALAAQMQTSFGFPGWAEVKLRLGHIYWSGDNFDDAKKLIGEVREKAKTVDKRYEAKTVFALARIAENQNDPDTAIAHYKDYVERFENGADREDATESLVLLYVDRHQWPEALAPLERTLKSESILNVDQRSVSGSSFALFWAGRVFLEQGRQDLAQEMWRRVASEYYSTYYGALGHFLLEKTGGKTLALQPARTPAFRMHALRDVFVPADRARIKRVEAMMKLGLHDEAVCELEELDIADAKPEKMLLKSVMLFASGRWLDAIKIYDALPRSFRTSLPAGFERMLFPQRFGETIRGLAKKAQIDPDLVMAIIRQESVFNPEARSPVGALGLMQLMPATAAMEAKRLSSPYVNDGEKKRLAHDARNPMALMTPETNLTIGVHHVKSLLAKYASPVFMLSAYNASPTAAARWMNTIPTKDILAFIERIPYKETRAYVKLVMRNYFYYKRWYQAPSEGLPHMDQLTSPLVAMARADADAHQEAHQSAADEGGTATPAPATNHHH